MLPSSNEYIKVSQNMGEPPTAQINKDLLLEHPIVSTNVNFSSSTNWKMVSFIFKHKTSKQRMIASFRSFESSSVSKMKVRQGLTNEMEFELHKIVIQKQDDSILAIRKNSIEDRSKYDFILGQFTTNTDFTSPSVVISAGVDSSTNSSVQLTITFSEEVTGFNQSKLELTNATAMGTISTDNKVFFCTVHPIQEGSVTVKVPAGCCTDLAGNANSGSNTISFTYDISAPISNLSLSPILSTEYANASSSFELLMEIAEEVQDLTISSFQLVNASLSLISKTGTNYLYSLMPYSDGLVSVKMPGGTIRDMAGNWVGESNLVSFIYDSTAPQFSLVLPSPTITTSYANSAINITVTMQDANPVYLNDPSILTLTNATASFVSSSENNSVFEITPTNQGLVTVKIEAGAVNDVAGNANTESNTVSFTYDTVPPVITLASSPILSSYSTVIYDPFTVTVTMSGYATGLAPDNTEVINGLGNDLAEHHITVLNGTISNFTKVSISTYTFTINPTSSGLGWVKIAANKILDEAGNFNSESNLLAFEYIALTNLIIPEGTTTYTLYHGRTAQNEPHQYRNVTVPANCTLLFDSYTSTQCGWPHLIVRGTLTLNGTIKARTKRYLSTLADRTITTIDPITGLEKTYVHPVAPAGGNGGNTSAGVTGGSTAFGNGGGGAWTWVQTYSSTPSYNGESASINQGGSTGSADAPVAGGSVPSGAGANGNKSYSAFAPVFPSVRQKASGKPGAGGARGYWGAPLYVKANNLVLGSTGIFDVRGDNGGKGGNGAPYGNTNNYTYQNAWGSGGGGGGAGGHGASIVVEVDAMSGSFQSYTNQFGPGTGGAGGTAAQGIGQSANNGGAGTSGTGGSNLIKGKVAFACTALSSRIVAVYNTTPDVKAGDIIKFNDSDAIQLTVYSVSKLAGTIDTQITFSSDLPFAAGTIAKGQIV
jgi:hypothetical protein